jgi:hypothetical protein
MSGKENSTISETWLEQDKEVPGQKYACLSFLSPEKVLANKEVFFYSKFLEDYEVQFKIQATEKFLMDQVTKVVAAVSKVEDLVANSSLPIVDVADLSGSPVKWRDESIATLADVRAKLTRNVADDLAVYVKTYMSDFKETKIQEAFENFMYTNRKKLEDEFFAKNEFRTTVRGLKVRGVYDTHQEASARAKTLQKLDPYFNVYVGQVGFWLPWDPEPNEVAEQEYAEDQLNTLMKSYKENEAKKEELYEEEKRQRLSGAKTSKPIFGPDVTASTANQLPTDMFSGAGDADLAISRKKALASASTINM